MEEIRSNMLGIGDDPRLNDFSIVKSNGYLMLAYKGVEIPFQTSMTLIDNVENPKQVSVDINIKCFVHLDNVLEAIAPEPTSENNDN